MRVEYDLRSFLLDGERRLVRAVSLDYFRLPSPALWRDRIEKIRASGWNAVSIAYPWSYHCEAPGSYDWSGARDVELLHDMLEEAGLYLIARPGPYIGCDLDAGGLPGWVLPGSRALRGRESGTAFGSLWFVRAASEWLSVVSERLARRSNLLCVQIEHLYEPRPPLAWVRSDLGTSLARWVGSEVWLRLLRLVNGPFVRPQSGTAAGAQYSRYMEALAECVRAHGITVPLVQTVLSPEGTLYESLDIPALARRRLCEVGLSPRDARASLVAMRGDEARLRARRSRAPLAYAGLDAGALDRWAGPGYAVIREQIALRPITTSVIGALSEGATLIDVRRFCGGTSWGYMASAGQYTSYDCGAPIAESGATDRAFDAMTQLNFWLDRHEQALCEAEPLPPEPALAGEASVYTASRRAPDQSYGFVVNMSSRSVPGVLVEDASRTGGELPPWSAQIRAYDPEGTLVDATAQRGAIAAFGGPGAPATWAARPEPLSPPELPALDQWTFCAVSPQLDASFDDSAWDVISPAAIERGEIDMDALGVHYGFIWYRGTFTGSLDRLVFAARHCCSVWVNRQLVYTGDPQWLPTGLGDEPLERVALHARGLPVQEDGRNTLVILVESLGHNEGVADDVRSKVGLVHLDTGATDVSWRYRGGLVRGERGMCPLVAFDAVGRGQTTDVALPHAWSEPGAVGLYETKFRLACVDPKTTQLALELDPGRGKANIYLNGLLIGRYWPERGPQHVFSLPWGIAEPDRENHIAIVVWKRSETSALGAVRLVVQG